jgi:hypothetical protein
MAADLAEIEWLECEEGAEAKAQKRVAYLRAKLKSRQCQTHRPIPMERLGDDAVDLTA